MPVCRRQSFSSIVEPTAAAYGGGAAARKSSNNNTDGIDELEEATAEHCVSTAQQMLRLMLQVVRACVMAMACAIGWKIVGCHINLQARAFSLVVLLLRLLQLQLLDLLLVPLQQGNPAAALAAIGRSLEAYLPFVPGSCSTPQQPFTAVATVGVLDPLGALVAFITAFVRRGFL
ncbi:hypothetical protein cyc_05122 [Cyclospora cayetanensis]|uniref:Uncharacterized protein n=1 Tax=Cyclospora cayetanensis TaxID=88456 RepID=A0A1D3D7Z8_9EIME|nr:hypothetical protein cyc_05122 [Cyclospora cayetanensis]